MRGLLQRYFIQLGFLVFIFMFVKTYLERSAICLKDLTPANLKRKISMGGIEKTAVISTDELSEAENEPNENVMRILWWTTNFGGKPGFYRIGNSKKTLRRMSKACNNSCEFVLDRSLANSSHAIIFNVWAKDLFVETVEVNGRNVTRPRDVPAFRDEKQYYIFWSDEAPVLMVKTLPLEAYNNFFNWTVNYRLDSDFPYTYGYMVKKMEKDVRKYNETKDHTNILKRKTNLVSWVVSNCNNTPSRRMDLVKELQKYIPVHIYGKCGKLRCRKYSCFRSYKFYLAFENTLCLDYVTEKFFKALRAKMVPIVYGKANYGHMFPPGSFINVDSFASPKALAYYLQYLDQNDEEYLKYFKWRRNYALKYTQIYTMHIFCDICNRLHRDYGMRKSILNLNKWLFNDLGSDFPICTEPQVF